VPLVSLSESPTPLPGGGLRVLLRQMGSPDEYGNPAPSVTGRLQLDDESVPREAGIYMRDGCVYAATFTGFVPPLARRLYSGGLINDQQLAYLLSLEDAQVESACIDQNMVSREHIEAINRQMILSSLVHLYGWSSASWRWLAEQATNAYTIPGLEISLTVSAADERVGAWDALVRNFPQVTVPSYVPQPGPDWGERTGQETTPEIAAILRCVDGQTNIARIAFECGFTRFEIASRLAKALADKLLIVVDPETGGVAGPVARLAADDPRQVEYDAAVAALDQVRVALSAAEDRVMRARQALAIGS